MYDVIVDEHTGSFGWSTKKTTPSEKRSLLQQGVLETITIESTRRSVLTYPFDA